MSARRRAKASVGGSRTPVRRRYSARSHDLMSSNTRSAAANRSASARAPRYPEVSSAAARLLGQPLPLALLAGAQLGVPVAAVTIGESAHVLRPGEGGAILAAALAAV